METARTPLKHRHDWSLVQEHMHGTFVEAEGFECSTCPARRWSGFNVFSESCPSEACA